MQYLCTKCGRGNCEVTARLGFLIEDGSITSLKNSKNSQGIGLGKKYESVKQL